MMKIKLWAALCALLLVIDLGSADSHDDGHAAPSNATMSGGGEATPEAPAVEPVPVTNPDSISQAVTEPSVNVSDTNSSAKVAGSLSNNTTAEEKSDDNGTNIVTPSETAGPEKNETAQFTPQPPIPPSASEAPTSHTPLNSSSARSTTHAANTSQEDASTGTAPPTNTSHQTGLPLPEASTLSTTLFTSVPTPEPPKSETTTTTTTTQSTSTSSTSSSQEPHSPESQKPTSQQPERHPETSSMANQKSSVLPPSSPTSAQAKAHVENPSQLTNGDAIMVHDTPTLDPLLAGLVSAFIITAVIITLLLFLKLRRRDNRPEFRRLQDLPMDDMMEDTPLSMYSY